MGSRVAQPLQPFELRQVANESGQRDFIAVVGAVIGIDILPEQSDFARLRAKPGRAGGPQRLIFYRPQVFTSLFGPEPAGGEIWRLDVLEPPWQELI